MVVPYIQGLVKSLKLIALRRGYKYTLRVQTPSKHYLWPPKRRTPNYKKVGSYTNTSALKLTVLKSILERLAGHMGMGSKNISGLHPPQPTYQHHRTPNQP